MPSLPSLPAALNLAQFSVCHLVPVTGRMTGVLKGFNYPRTQIMIAYLWAHVLEENRICALCIRALHFLCLLLEPEKWLREIHAHFPAIPTHGGEAESVGEDFQYLWYFDTPGSEWWWWGGAVVSGRRRGVENTADSTLDNPALGISHSKLMDSTFGGRGWGQEEGLGRGDDACLLGPLQHFPQVVFAYLWSPLPAIRFAPM